MNVKIAIEIDDKKIEREVTFDLGANDWQKPSDVVDYLIYTAKADGRKLMGIPTPVNEGGRG